MIEKLFYWLIDRLADFLGGLNPERKKKIEAIKAEGERLDALAVEEEKRRAESEIIYRVNSEKRAEWDRLAMESEQQVIDSQARFVASQMKVREVEAQLAETQEFIRSRSDVDVLRDRL